MMERTSHLLGFPPVRRTLGVFTVTTFSVGMRFMTESVSPRSTLNGDIVRNLFQTVWEEFPEVLVVNG